MSFSPRLKIVLLIIAAFLLYATVSTTPSGSGGLISRANLVPLILTLIALLGAAYQERWVFDRQGGRLIYQFGLVFAHGNRFIQMSSLKEVKLARFIKGRLTDKQEGRRSLWQRTVVTLSLADREGKIYRLETYQNMNLERVEQTARTIADYCGLPLVSWEKEAQE